MKKILTVLTACALMTACGEKKSEYDKYYESDYQPDTTATAATPVPVTPAPEDNTTVAKEDTAATGTTAAGKKAAGKEALAGNYEQGAKLISMSDCLTCHKDDQRIVGPSYVEVAQKYEFNEKNVDYLAGKIIKGGAGVWGQVPMPPHPDLKKEDAAEMAKYVLSLRK